MKGCLIILLGFIGISAQGFADDLHLVINGKSIHLAGQGYNENNWGLGFEYDFEPEGKWIPLITGSSFKDSNKQVSNYLGGGTKRRFLFGSDPDGMHVDVGVVGFLMTRKDFKNGNPFFGALPFISVGNTRVAVNATYIPKVTPKSVPLLYFQLMIKMAEF